MTQKIAPYGSWESPISARQVAEAGTGSSALPKEIHVENGVIYWIEQRPREGGRYVIASLQPDGNRSVMTPEGFSVRSRVHEYGGGAYCVRGGSIIFVNDQDQRLYRHDPDREPYPITPEPSEPRTHRYADGTFSPDGDWTLWVRERHDKEGKIHNEIVLLPADGSSPSRSLIGDHDFFSNPRFSPDGRHISWLTWDHPHMPWDRSDLWTAPMDLDLLEIGASMQVAGGEDTSIFQPEWGPDGLLYFVSDKSGWWNIYRKNADDLIENLCPIQAEFGYPQWLFGFTKYAFLTDEIIIASFKDNGQAELGLIHTDAKTLKRLNVPYTTFENPSMRAGNNKTAWFFAGAADHPPALCCYDHSSGSTDKILDLFDLDLDPGFISKPEFVQFESQQGRSSFAFYYAPKNEETVGPADVMPPLIVMSHGGPTSSARPHLDLEVQFWTSRGFAVVDVDYSGSVGYGRAYRERLISSMGRIDVYDCVAAARHLVDTGKVDPSRLIARGSSAGGYVTLSALTFYELFSAGGIYYGIADVTKLAEHTHKFEAHYLDTLIGPYPEEIALYRERSPINHTDRLNCPIILFQGLDDKVVPPEQSKSMADALDERGLPYAYLTFENESHGFDRSETIEAALSAEAYFYKRVLNIPVESSEALIDIKNI